MKNEAEKAFGGICKRATASFLRRAHLQLQYNERLVRLSIDIRTSTSSQTFVKVVNKLIPSKKSDHLSLFFFCKKGRRRRSMFQNKWKRYILQYRTTLPLSSVLARNWRERAFLWIYTGDAKAFLFGGRVFCVRTPLSIQKKSVRCTLLACRVSES